MTPKEKNSMLGKINTLVSQSLKEYGFIKTKKNWFVKAYEEYALFMHLHCFSSSNSFRVHIGYRNYNDPFEAIALNGKQFQGSKIDNLINPETGKLYHLSFNRVKPTVTDCSTQIVSLFKHECLPWFKELNIKNILDSFEMSENSKKLSKALLKIK